MELCSRLADELRMIGSALPPDINITDMADLLPPDDAEWQPPRIAAVLYKGTGKAGGK